MKAILHLYEKGRALIATGKPVTGITKSGILEKLIKMKYDIPNDKPEVFDEYIAEIDSLINSLISR